MAGSEDGGAFDPFGSEDEAPAAPAAAPAQAAPAAPEKRGDEPKAPEPVKGEAKEKKGKKAKEEKEGTRHVDEKPQAPVSNSAIAVLPSAQVARPTLFGFLKEHLAIIAKLDFLSAEESTASDAKHIESINVEIAKLAEELAKNAEGVEKKIVGWGCWIEGMGLDSDGLKKIIDKLSRRKAMFDGATKAAKTALCGAMDAMGIPKVTAPEMTVWTQDNPEALDIERTDMIPVKFFKEPEPVESRLDKAGLLKAIKEGMPIPPGVVVRRGRHVRVRM